MSKAKSVTRRGFLGTLGAVGAAVAIPLNWSREEKLPVVLELPEGAPPPEGYEEIFAEEGYTFEGTWDSTPSIKGRNPQIQIDGTKFDLYNYDMSFNANITEDYAFGDGPFATKGLSELEVECSFIGKQGLVETMKWDTKTRHIVIDTGDHKFEFDAYPKSISHNYAPGVEDYTDPQHETQGLLSSVTFVASGEVKRIQGN